MYEDLTENQKKILNLEQKKIIDSKDKYIVVSASPGCGKTYTLVKRIKGLFENRDDSKGFIACSFTQEASRQLEKKLDKELDLSLSFVGTIDSFVLKDIIDKFKNRYLINVLKFDDSIDRLDVSIPVKNDLSNDITKVGYSHKNIYSYYDKWIKNFSKGEYTICYCSYILCCNMIKEMSEVKNYITNRYKTIFIDEAQDMNEFQHELVNCLKSECDIDIFVIGDKNQSIYEFRGAKPELFSKLEKKGYSNYNISVSVRCHKSIMDFSNYFLDKNANITSNDILQVKVHKKADFTKEDLEKLILCNFSILILCNSNSYAERLLDMSEKNAWGFTYTKAINIKNKNFNQSYLYLLEELIKFYYNFKNPISKLVYSVEKISDIILDYIVQKDLKRVLIDLIDTNKNVTDYIQSIFDIINKPLGNSTITEISTQLNDNIYINHYKKTLHNKRIMTIHSSKGLEAEVVLVFVAFDDWLFNEESDLLIEKRKYYVAFSRAKKELNIFFQKTRIKDTKIVKLNQDNIINLIMATYEEVEKSVK